MRLLKNRAIDFYLCFVLILIMAIGGSTIVFADSGPVTVTLSAGGLSLSGPTSVNAIPVTLNGRDQFSIYTLPLVVTDARGTGAGWNLSITSTAFINTTFTTGSTGSGDSSDDDSEGGPVHLGNNASVISSVMEACNVGSNCTPATDSVSYPVAVPAGTTPPPPVQFFNAGTNSGLGSVIVKPTISVRIPGFFLPGVYKSTVYVTLVNGQQLPIVVTLPVGLGGEFGDDQTAFTPTGTSTVKYTLPLNFNNAGSRIWHLSITSTQFTIGNSSAHTLPTTASSLVGMTGVCQAKQNCADNVLGYPIFLPAGNPAPNPVTFYDGTANTGNGPLNVMAALEVVIPGNASAGTYTSTVTVAFQSGP